MSKASLEQAMESSPPSAANSARTRLWGALLVGLSFGGLFDGILLHQVLQWHHLLSLVGGESVQDIRFQILADGIFHVLMYAIACIGLAMMWFGNASPSKIIRSARYGAARLRPVANHRRRAVPLGAAHTQDPGR